MWLEGRPVNGGKYTLVRYNNGKVQDVSPLTSNVRTRVHEYGGASFVPIYETMVAISEFTDQKLYKVGLTGGNKAPRLLTKGERYRYADGIFNFDQNAIYAVREEHSEDGKEEAKNTIVKIDCNNGKETVLASGYDFYLSPRLSPNGKFLAYVAYNHPNMPWDDTTLFVKNMKTAEVTTVCGGEGKSVSVW